MMIKRLALFSLVLLLLCFSETIFSQQIKIQAIGVSADELLSYNFLTGKENYNLVENVQAYFKWSLDRGYNLFCGIEFYWFGSVDDPDDSAVVYYNSPTLIAKGYNFYPEFDILPTVISEANKLGIKIYVDIESLAHANFDLKPHDPNLQKLTPEDIRQVIAELHDFGVTGIYEEAYPNSFVKAIWEKTRQLNMEYIHCFDEYRGYADMLASEDYHFYPLNEADINRIEPMGTLGNSIGNLNVMFGHAQALDIPTLMGTAGNWGFKPGMQNNITIFRLIGFNPLGFAYYIADEQDEQWVMQNYIGTLIKDLYQEFGKEYKKRPIANLIINLPFDKPEYDADSYAVSEYDLLTNTLTAAGYDLYVTHDSVYKDKEVETYIILTYGYSQDNKLSMDLPHELTQLFSSDKRVLLITCTGIPNNTENWRTVRKALGIVEDKTFDYRTQWKYINTILPSTVTYQDQQVRFSGIDMWISESYADIIPPSDVSSEIILSGKIDGKNSVLLIRNNNKFFLNGHPVHLDMIFVLANLLKPAGFTIPFNKPTFSYISLGEITAILAGEDTQIDMNLPIDKAKVRLVEYNDSGIRMVNNLNYPFSNPFTYNLNKWHLLVIDGSEPTNVLVDIKINGSDSPVTLDQSDTINITVSLDSNRTDNADWWLAADTSFGLWFYTFEGWTTVFLPVYQGPLLYLDTYEVFNTPVSGLPAGTYTFYFGVDTDMDGNITWNSLYYDTAIVNDIKEDPLPLSQVKYWAYQIQDISEPGAVDALANSHYDMLVLEPTRTDWSSDDKYFDTKGMVERLKNTKASDSIHRKLIIAYIDIGEAENWRWYWKWSKEWPEGEPCPPNWPDYILTHDPDGWEGNFPVAYWDERWKDIVIYGRNQDSGPYGDYNSVIDEAIKGGFDGIYLDWVEGFENDAVIQEAQRQGKDPAVEMINFIQEMRDYATQRIPNFLIIQQNAAALADGHPELFSKIDAISQEAIWYDGNAYDDWNAPDGYDISNDPSLSNYYLNYLDRYKAAVIPVFNCEYALNCADEAYNKSYDKWYIPYCTRRALSRLTTTPPPGYFHRDDGAYKMDISQSGSLQNPAWSPDDKSILFTSKLSD